MRKTLQKIIFAINLLAAFALLLSYLLPYISPKTFPLLSVLSLAVPVLISINIIFLAYWTILLKKKLWISFFVLLLGFTHITNLYKFGDEVETSEEGVLSLFTYNVHSFNRFRWIDSPSIPQDISRILKKYNPDIFCAQEYYNNPDIDFSQYIHKYEFFNHNSRELALVIFSKFPIINKGSFDFKNTANNIIYADLARKKDTIRVYNVHLQSHSISTQTKDLANADSQKMVKRMSVAFRKQQSQTEKLIDHMRASPYPTIVMGDFNNTAYSYIYNKITDENMQDTFKEAGSGFGKTFKFDLFPARIDFIFIPEGHEVVSCKTFTEELSDHFPILSKVKW